MISGMIGLNNTQTKIDLITKSVQTKMLMKKLQILQEQKNCEGTLKMLQKEGAIPMGIAIQKLSVSEMVAQNKYQLGGKCLARTKYNGLYYGEISQFGPSGSGCFFLYPDGSYFEGNVAAGKRNGKGVLRLRHETGDIYKFTGTWADGLPTGFGEEFIERASLYKGEFLKGQKHGKGELIYHDGSKYQGNFENNKINGQGTFSTSANRWQGNWKNGYLQGKGKQILLDENQMAVSEYTGDFVHGEKDGYGQYLWGNNCLYDGQFKQGILHGEGKLTIDNAHFKGKWEQGLELKLSPFNSNFSARQSKKLSNSIVLERINVSDINFEI